MHATITDEDSGDEETLNNLPGSQLLAEAELKNIQTKKKRTCLYLKSRLKRRKKLKVLIGIDHLHFLGNMLHA